ncbi:MAG: DUF3575 domain-containing protein [Bacteroidales bacterium]
MRKRIYFLYVILFLSLSFRSLAFEAQDRKKFTFYFQLNKSRVDTLYMGNQEAFDSLRHSLSQIRFNRNDSVIIEAFSSPEGVIGYNYALSEKRTQSLYRFLQTNLLDKLPSNVRLNAGNINWQGLENAIDTSSFSGNKQLMDLFRSNLTDEKLQYALKQINNGTDYRYFLRKYFPRLRTGEVFLIIKSSLSDLPVLTIPLYQMADRLQTDPRVAIPVNTENLVPSPDCYYTERIQPVAFKTNLLYDLATAINVEIEVPLARRWSIAAEWIFPWWVDEKNQNCLQVLSGTLEGKYWFSPNRKEMLRNDLTGWYAGLYAGGGLYDIEWHKKGYQGEFYLAAGISAGFAHKIGRDFSLEYGIGVGYLDTDYRKYKAQKDSEDKWVLVRQKRGSYSYLGPTKIKVSLVWRPSFYVKKKGGKL